MKIEVNEIGGGLTRLNIVASPWEGTVPTAVADDIVRDVIRRKQNGDYGCGCHTTVAQTRPVVAQPMPTPNRGVESGIDAHIDRPNRSNYGGVQWAADRAYREDMRKYNSAVSAIKACDWPCKEDMKGVPSAISQHNPLPRTQMVGIPNYRNFSAPQSRPALCGCGSEKMALREAIVALAAIVERM